MEALFKDHRLLLGGKRHGTVAVVESGRSWDDCIRRYDICENGKGGCFKITTQYFLEASEGFGSRCAYYLSTFEILPEQG